MKCAVFVGPTLSRDEASCHLDALYLPPVAQGDVYRVALKRPPAIGIIDGYFDREPAVWHKEILWAMTEGIPVFGSGSMGALRAAELAMFGMEGVGEIFRAYRDGILEDDDEVALAHAPAEYGYKPLSEPMVNIRFTLERAVSLKIISSQSGSALEGIAKRLHYRERNYTPILQEAAATDAVPLPEIETLR